MEVSRRIAAFVGLAVLAACGGGAPAPGPGLPPAPAPFGLAERVDPGDLRFPVAPEGSGQVSLVRAFPHLTFDSPATLTYAPDGTGRIFVAEIYGKVKVFPGDEGATTTKTFLDLSARLGTVSVEGLVTLAFDPDYARNGFFYVMYVQQDPKRTLLSRFRVSADPDAADPASETVLLEVPQPHRQHNGNMLAFGPDGMLYASFGDGGGEGDPYRGGQDRTNLRGTIARIDPHGGTPYAVPASNPFAGATDGTRPEIWAYGFRNPWRFSFDRATGDLWVGDPGGVEREEIDRVRAGGNYGWPVYEGDVVLEGGAPASDFEAPVLAYGRADGVSVIGGHVYRGRAVPALQGAYVYGDYGNGAVRALRWDGARVTARETLGTVPEVCSFGEDADGELYAISYGGALYRFAQDGGGAGEVPARLSETGLFADTLRLQPAPGVIEYDVNAPLWSDGARKRRWIALPAGGRIGFDATGPWSFPVGTVLVKHFELELAPGEVQRIETRVLVHESAGWAGYTYRWNFLQTDADLLPGAATQTFSVEDPRAPGGRRDQTWSFPSRAQCMLCHTEAAGRVLGVKARQLNRAFAYAAATDNQLRAWNHVGLFDRDVGDPVGYAAMPDPRDAARPVADRARAWLDANCSHCHRPGGPTPADLDLRYATPRASMGVVNVRPAYGDLGLPDPWLLRPGAKESSVLWERLRRLDGTRMPNVGSDVVDADAVALVGAWIDDG